MKKSLLLLAVILSGLALQAQVNYEFMKAADTYFKDGDYFSAAQYYEKALGKSKSKGKNTGGFSPYGSTTVKPIKNKVPVSDKDQATYNLAESYRLLFFHEKAEPYYKEAIMLDRSKFPLAQFHHATTLRALQKNQEAEAAFKEFLATYSGNDKYKEDAQRELTNLQFAATQMDKVDMTQYTIGKAKGDLPDTGAVYAPVWFNNTVYFTSTKPVDGVPKLQVNNNRVYQASFSDSGISNVMKAPIPEVHDVHQGVVSLSPDGNRVIFSRWTIGDGKKNSSLYISKKANDTWSEPIALPATINVEGYNAQQALIMPDGKTLIYSSDMPGGQGGFDLWTVTLDELDNAGTPMNLGPSINTANDEHAPFYHAASKSLVFSSNGRVGMGGFDFYYSVGEPGRWGEVRNFGYPLNSFKDDIYFASRGRATNILEDVLFSSDRDAACCLELFSLKKKNAPRVISGTVVSCDKRTPIAGATVNIMDTEKNLSVVSKTTGQDGTYSFSIDDYKPLKAIASANGYQSSELSFNAPSDINSFEMSNPDICLTPIKVDEAVVVNNVYYDFNSAELRSESFPELDKLVTMFEANPDIKVEISAHTDNKGTDEYNQKLSDERAKSVVNYLVKKGIKASQLISKGYGEGQPVAENENADGTDNPEGRQQNRRTEFKVLNQ